MPGVPACRDTGHLVRSWLWCDKLGAGRFDVVEPRRVRRAHRL